MNTEKLITMFGITASSNNVVILGSDTDIWVYGMVYQDCGWLGSKAVFVEKEIGVEYACITKLHVSLSYMLHEDAYSHPQIKQIQFPLPTLAAIYILTGGDYISSFYHTSSN